MSIFGRVHKAIQDQYIARPAEASGSLIWRYPNIALVNGARCTVRSDEVLLFFRDGRLVGQLEAGAYELSSANVPFWTDLVVSPLTGGNQHLAELFFVRKAECLLDLPLRTLCTVQDLNSHLVLTLLARARFAVQVTDPVALVTQLGGQDQGSEARVLEFVFSRLTSSLQSIVGRFANQAPVMNIVSNAVSEDIGHEVRQRVSPDFQPQGLDLTRFLELHIELDSDGIERMRNYGNQQAELNITSRGAELANNPGFQAFHLAQGQRAMLEGLGAGLSTGNMHMPLMGLGVGGLGMGGGMPVQRQIPSSLPLPSPTPRVPTGPQAVLATGIGQAAPPIGQTKFFMRTLRGDEGPYRARQVAIRIVADQLDPATTMIREEDDATWFAAGQDPGVREELLRRNVTPAASLPAVGAPAPQQASVFEPVFAMAVADGVLTASELAMLIPVAVSAGLAPNEMAAKALIMQRAVAIGCRIEP